jgi:hypothetical protein
MHVIERRRSESVKQSCFLGKFFAGFEGRPFPMSVQLNTPQLRRLDTGLGVQDANFPLDGEGRTYHVGVKAGEVASRVVSVGDPRSA